MTEELLISWLLHKGFAEESRGYGHVSADELANALVTEFEIIPRDRQFKTLFIEREI